MRLDQWTAVEPRGGQRKGQMMSSDPQDPKVKTLGWYLSTLRPGWDCAGIWQALTLAAERRPWEQVEQMALRAVRDPKAQTPAAVGFATHLAEPPRDTRPGPSAMFCPRCRAVVVPQVEHSCTPGDAARGMSLVRSALPPRTPTPKYLQPKEF